MFFFTSNYLTMNCINIDEESDKKGYMKNYIAENCPEIEFEEFKRNYGEDYKAKGLGGGSYAQVYLYENSSGTQTAMKTFKNTNIDVMFTELNTSACLTNSIENPGFLRHFAPIVNCHFMSPLYHMTMKYYPTTLHKYMKKNISKPFDDLDESRQEKIRSILRDLAQGVKIFHSLEMVHYDLTLYNILLDENDFPVIADYSVVQLNNNQGAKKVGSMYYTDPLLIRNKIAGPLNDIFSLGIMFYLVLAGPEGINIYQSLVKSNFTSQSTDFLDPLEFPEGFGWIKEMITLDPQSRISIDQVLTNLKEDILIYPSIQYYDDRKERKLNHENMLEELKKSHDNQDQVGLLENKQIDIFKSINKNNNQVE